MADSPRDLALVSFPEHVPESQRPTRRKQIENFGQDGIFHPKGGRPPTLEERDTTHSAVIFHHISSKGHQGQGGPVSSQTCCLRKRRTYGHSHNPGTETTGGVFYTNNFTPNGRCPAPPGAPLVDISALQAPGATDLDDEPAAARWRGTGCLRHGRTT